MSVLAAPWSALLEMLAGAAGSWLLAALVYGLLARLLMTPMQLGLVRSARRLAALGPQLEQIRHDHADSSASEREDALVASYSAAGAAPMAPLGWVAAQVLLSAWMLFGLLGALNEAPPSSQEPAHMSLIGLVAAALMGLGVLHMLTGRWPQGLRRRARPLILRLIVGAGAAILVSYSALLVMVFLATISFTGLLSPYLISRFYPAPTS